MRHAAASSVAPIALLLGLPVVLASHSPSAPRRRSVIPLRSLSTGATRSSAGRGRCVRRHGQGLVPHQVVHGDEALVDLGRGFRRSGRRCTRGCRARSRRCSGPCAEAAVAGAPDGARSSSTLGAAFFGLAAAAEVVPSSWSSPREVAPLRADAEVALLELELGRSVGGLHDLEDRAQEVRRLLAPGRGRWS